MTHYTRGTQSLRTNLELPLFVSIQFQELFHSPCRGAFHLSLTVLVHYRSLQIFSLGEWSPLLPTGFLGSRGTQAHGRRGRVLRYWAITMSRGPFQDPLRNVPFCQTSVCRAYNPTAPCGTLVWAGPRSLATTNGISVDFLSSRY